MPRRAGCAMACGAMSTLTVESTRSGFVESVHRVSVAVTDAEGRLVASRGRPGAHHVLALGGQALPGAAAGGGRGGGRASASARASWRWRVPRTRASRCTARLAECDAARLWLRGGPAGLRAAPAAVPGGGRGGGARRGDADAEVEQLLGQALGDARAGAAPRLAHAGLRARGAPGAGAPAGGGVPVDGAGARRAAPGGGWVHGGVLRPAAERHGHGVRAAGHHRGSPRRAGCARRCGRTRSWWRARAGCARS